MKITELTRDELERVKQAYYMEKNTETGVSWGELSDINTLVSDREVFEAYADTEFTKGDFE